MTPEISIISPLRQIPPGRDGCGGQEGFGAVQPCLDCGKGLAEVQAGPPSLLALLETSEGGPAPFAPRGRRKKDFAIGAGGALLVHALVAFFVLFTALADSKPHSGEFVIHVFLADAGGAGKEGGGPPVPGDAGVASPNEGEATGGVTAPEAAVPEHASDPPVVSPEPVRAEPAVDPPVPQAPVPAEKVAVPDPPPKPVKIAKRPDPAKTVVKKPSVRPKAEPKALPPAPSAVSEVSGAAPEKPVASGDAGTGSGRELEKGEGAGSGSAPGAGRGAGGAGGNFSGSGGTGEFDATAVDQAPVALKKIEPVYPRRARSLGICGRVVLRFLVEPDGHVSKPCVVNASPAGYFEESAVDAIRHWRFKPGRFQGRAVSTWVTLPVQFRLVEED